MTGQFSGTDAGNANLTITDGTTTGYGINKITVSAGDLTSASNGEAVIDTSGGGGGGSGVSSISFDSTGLTPNTVSTGAIVVGGQLNIANGGTGSSSASGARTALGLEIGTNVQAYDAGLNDIAGLSNADGNFIVGNGSNWIAESGSTVRNSLGLGTIATQDSNAVSITGGSITGITDLAIADGGTGASTAATALSNLGGLPLTADISATGSGFSIASTDAGKIFVMTVGGAGNLAVNCTGTIGTFPVGFQCVVLLTTTAGGQVQLTPTNSGKLNGSTSATVNLTTAYKAYTLVIVSQDGGVNNWVAIG